MLSSLLSTWEEVRAAEEQHAAQETELFKNKTQTSTFQTEEVPACRPTLMSRSQWGLQSLCSQSMTVKMPPAFLRMHSKALGSYDQPCLMRASARISLRMPKPVAGVCLPVSGLSTGCAKERRLSSFAAWYAWCRN